MPHVPSMIPSTRIFARLDKFECECPSCGQIIRTTHNAENLPARLKSIGQQRGAARLRPKSPAIEALVWNPYSQRLRCPWCDAAWVCGLMVYPVKPGMWRVRQPPPDAHPNKRELAQLRHATGGWWAEQEYVRESHVNLVVDQPCSCPPGEQLASCPIHGASSQVQQASEEAKVEHQEEHATAESVLTTWERKGK